MPELPEVETIVRGLRTGQDQAPSLVGQTIESVTTRWPRHIVEPEAAQFRKQIRGRRIEAVDRRGKYIAIQLDNSHLLIHLRMSGDLALTPGDEPLGAFEHTVFHLTSGWDLRFRDARKFGRVHLVKDPETVLGKLGPEPLAEDFRAADLTRILRSRSRQLKPLLLDQTVLAGVGNIYADEALHRAGLHPLRKSDSLSDEEIRRLWRGLRAALRHGIRANGASLDWVYQGGSFQEQLRVYGRTGDACPTCGGEISRIIVGQRGTHLCPTCQPELDDGG